MHRALGTLGLGAREPYGVFIWAEKPNVVEAAEAGEGSYDQETVHARVAGTQKTRCGLPGSAFYPSDTQMDGANMPAQLNCGACIATIGETETAKLNWQAAYAVCSRLARKLSAADLHIAELSTGIREQRERAECAERALADRAEFPESIDGVKNVRQATFLVASLEGGEQVLFDPKNGGVVGLVVAPVPDPDEIPF